MEPKLKAVNSKLNNAEDQTSDLEDIIMEITQSKQQTGSQMEKKRMKAI